MAARLHRQVLAPVVAAAGNRARGVVRGRRTANRSGRDRGRSRNGRGHGDVHHDRRRNGRRRCHHGGRRRRNQDRSRSGQRRQRDLGLFLRRLRLGGRRRLGLRRGRRGSRDRLLRFRRRLGPLGEPGDAGQEQQQDEHGRRDADDPLVPGFSLLPIRERLVGLVRLVRGRLAHGARRRLTNDDGRDVFGGTRFRLRRFGHLDCGQLGRLRFLETDRVTFTHALGAPVLAAFLADGSQTRFHVRLAEHLGGLRSGRRRRRDLLGIGLRDRRRNDQHHEGLRPFLRGQGRRGLGRGVRQIVRDVRGRLGARVDLRRSHLEGGLRELVGGGGFGRLGGSSRFRRTVALQRGLVGAGLGGDRGRELERGNLGRGAFGSGFRTAATTRLGLLGDGHG